MSVATGGGVWEVNRRKENGETGRCVGARRDSLADLYDCTSVASVGRECAGGGKKEMAEERNVRG